MCSGGWGFTGATLSDIKSDQACSTPPLGVLSSVISLWSMLVLPYLRCHFFRWSFFGFGFWECLMRRRIGCIGSKWGSNGRSCASGFSWAGVSCGISLGIGDCLWLVLYSGCTLFDCAPGVWARYAPECGCLVEVHGLGKVGCTGRSWCPVEVGCWGSLGCGGSCCMRGCLKI